MSAQIQSKRFYQKLQKKYSRKIDLKLKRINFALKKLGNIHNSIKNPINFIGSDGKYSTLKSLQYFIETSGAKCSFFVSPHLKLITERIWLKDRFISIKEFKNNIKIIRQLKVKLTLFELINLTYYISAAKLKNVSFALVEAGLLYAKDSTRVWDQPRCQVITNINKQHLEWVKPKTIRAICQQKVGYLSKKTTIYVGKQEPKTMQIIKEILKKNPSRKVYYGSGWTLKKLDNKRIYKDNRGKIILKSKKILSDGLWNNVGLAIRVARDLKISKKNILKALPKLQFSGRLEYIKGKLTKLLNPKEKLLIDGCHSEASAKNLASYLKSIDKDIYGIWGMQKHKHPDLFIKQFKEIFKKIIAVKIPDEPNTCKPHHLKNMANRSGIKCDVAPSIEAAIKQLSSKKPKVIVSFGSLYLVGKILSLN